MYTADYRLRCSSNGWPFERIASFTLWVASRDSHCHGTFQCCMGCLRDPVRGFCVLHRDSLPEIHIALRSNRYCPRRWVGPEEPPCRCPPRVLCLPCHSKPETTRLTETPSRGPGGTFRCPCAGPCLTAANLGPWPAPPERSTDSYREPCPRAPGVLCHSP